jgi:fatty-acid desaturase
MRQKESSEVTETMWYQGLLQRYPAGKIAVTLILTHITIVSVTVYHHRYSAIARFTNAKRLFRFWL